MIPHSVSFSYKVLTAEMLNGTIWYSRLTIHPLSEGGGFMAVRYANSQAIIKMFADTSVGTSVIYEVSQAVKDNKKTGQ